MEPLSDSSSEIVPSDGEVGRRIELFLHNQGRELDLRAQELELQKVTAGQEHDYARASLAAQERIMEKQLLAQRRQKTDFYWLVGVAMLVGAAILGMALWFNKDQVALEIIKDIVLVFGGSAGGYAIGRTRQNPPDQDPSPSE